MKVLSIAFNYDELLKDLEELSKYYPVSKGVEELLLKKESLPEWDKRKNKKYIIYLYDENYISYDLYENYCKYYLESKGVNVGMTK